MTQTLQKTSQPQCSPDVQLQRHTSFQEAYDVLLKTYKQSFHPDTCIHYADDHRHIGLHIQAFIRREADYRVVLMTWIKDNFAPLAKVPADINWLDQHLQDKTLKKKLLDEMTGLFGRTPKDTDEIHADIETIEKTYMEILFRILPALSLENRENLPQWTSELMRFLLGEEIRKFDCLK